MPRRIDVPTRASASLALLLALAAPLAAPLGAQAPLVFHTCYVPLTGTVYRVQTPDTRPACASTAHVPFSWTDGLNALRVGAAASGDLAGTFPGPSVVALRGRALSALVPTAGQVLTFDGTAWKPAASPSGVTDHGLLAGLADDDHPQYVLANGVRATTNGFAVTGTLGTGTIPATGPGVRVMWYPRKAAFRAGRVDGPAWDDVNVGSYSFAAGFNARAIGSESAAFGEARAEATLAFATGSSTAGGSSAVAMGRLANAGGSQAVALGNEANASAQSAIAIGNLTRAAAVGAVAIGSGVRATGDHSVALGTAAWTNDHPGTFVFGDNSSGGIALQASADNQFAVRAQHVWLGRTNAATNPAGHFLTTSTGGYLSTGGTWTNSSRRAGKENFAALDADDVLAKLVVLPVMRWNYKVEPDSTRHIGPVAEDFHAAFGLGGSAEHLAPSDLGGVTLLGIQALERRTRVLERENAELRARLERIEAALRQRESPER